MQRQLSAIEYSHRRFSLHLFWVGHGVLLLRSGADNEHTTRVDILFRDVVWLNMPVWFRGIAVGECAVSEVLPNMPASLLPEAEFRTAYKLTTEGTNCYVVCGGVEVTEDQGNYLEPSTLLPELQMPKLIE